MQLLPQTCWTITSYFPAFHFPDLFHIKIAMNFRYGLPVKTKKSLFCRHVSMQKQSKILRVRNMLTLVIMQNPSTSRFLSLILKERLLFTQLIGWIIIFLWKDLLMNVIRSYKIIHSYECNKIKIIIFMLFGMKERPVVTVHS